MNSKMFRILVFALNFIFLFGSISNADPSIPIPSNTISFSEYRTLVKDSVRRIPDLAPMWAWADQHQLKGIYLGGGALRGLLKWVNIQLATRTPSEIMKLPVPKVQDLLINKSGDKDLYTPDHLKKTIKSWSSYSDWDIIGESFYQDTLRNEGSTIDKLRINPNWADDPFNALMQFYEGRIEIKFSPDWNKSDRSVRVLGDTRIGLALRFIRFVFDLREVVAPNAQSSELVKKLILEDASELPWNDKEVHTWAGQKDDKAESVRVRITRSLVSLMTAVSNNAFVFIHQLKAFGFFEVLAMKNYSIPSVRFDSPDLQLGRYREAGLKHRDMYMFARMAGWDLNRTMAFHAFLLSTAQTNEDVIRSFAFHFERPSNEYKSRLQEFAVANFNVVLQKLDFSTLTEENMLLLERNLGTIPESIRLKEEYILRERHRINSSVVLSSANINPSVEYLKAIENLKLRLQRVEVLSEGTARTRLVPTCEILFR